MRTSTVKPEHQVNRTPPPASVFTGMVLDVDSKSLADDLMDDPTLMTDWDAIELEALGGQPSYGAWTAQVSFRIQNDLLRKRWGQFSGGGVNRFGQLENILFRRDQDS